MNIQEVIDKTMAEFEADLLDGNNLEDCGKAMLLAEYVWEWIEAKLQEIYQQGRKDGVNEAIECFNTHNEGEGSWCDTGEDMEWACRSECVESGTNRANKILSH